MPQAAAVKSSPTPLIRITDGVFSPDWVRSGGVRILVILAVAVAVSWLAGLAVRRVRRRMEGSPAHTVEMDLRRAATIAHAMTNTTRIVVWTVAVLMILSEFGVNLGPLLASAGVLGVALSFGAQSIVRDFLSGFFTLFEDQYRVGDTVDITAPGGAISGKVEVMTLRYTAVRAADGTLSSIGNGTIQYVANRSRGRGRISVDVKVPGTNVEEVERRLDAVVQALGRDRSLERLLPSGVSVVGVEPTTTGDVLVTVGAEVWPSRRDQAEAAVRRRLARALAAGSHAPGAEVVAEVDPDPGRTLELRSGGGEPAPDGS